MNRIQRNLLIASKSGELGVKVSIEVKGTNWMHFKVTGKNVAAMERWLMETKPAGIAYTFACNIKGHTFQSPLLRFQDFPRASFNNPEGYTFGSWEAMATYHRQRLNAKYLGKMRTPQTIAQYMEDMRWVNEEILKEYGVNHALTDGGHFYN